MMSQSVFEVFRYHIKLTRYCWQLPECYSDDDLINHHMQNPKQSVTLSPVAHFLFADTRTGVLWLILRLYIGWEWLQAGYEKLINPAWFGDHAGSALTGFLNGALQKTSAAHPDVSSWYAWFIQNLVLPHTVIFSYVVSIGEVLTGMALILGLFTSVAAFAGGFMNMNYLLAGTVSINPIMLLIEILLILAWRVAGWYGLDRWALPFVGTLGQAGHLSKSKLSQ